MNLAGCAGLALGPVTGTWYRAVPLAHYQTLLAFAHTATTASRFNVGDPRLLFPVLYFAQTPQVALFEAGAVIGSPMPGAVSLPNPGINLVTISVQIQLHSVADLTDPAQLSLLQTSVQELTGDWIGYRLRNPAAPNASPFTDVPTQELGAELAAAPQIEAFLTYSARDSRHTNLVVFPQKLVKGSWLKFANPVTNKIDRIGP